MPPDDELADLLGRALDPESRVPPPQRVAALRTAVAERGDKAPRRPLGSAQPRLPRFLLVVAAAAAVLVAFMAGGLLADREVSDDGGRNVEFAVTLRAPGGGSAAQVTGFKTGIGRIVRLRSMDLPILPKSEYYEVWFVGPGDTPAQPNRISAGTFHPDDQGRSDVELTAAVDPAKYPQLSVTAESGDGNPQSNGTEVLRAPVQVRR